MTRSFVALLFFVGTCAAIDYTTCSGSVVWIQFPFPRDQLLDLIRNQTGSHFSELEVLDVSSVYGEGNHVIQIEFDVFTKCHLPGLPITLGHFQEFALQIPFVNIPQLAGSLNVTYQPMAYIDNEFGVIATESIGARHAIAPFTTAATNGVRSVVIGPEDKPDVSVSYTPLGDYVSVKDVHSAKWQAMYNGKHEADLGFQKPPLGSEPKFQCSDLRYDLETARIRDISGSMTIGDLAAVLPGLRPGPVDLQAEGVIAYEVLTSFTVGHGCKSVA